MTDNPISEAFALICDLGMKDGIKPLNQHEGCWTRKVGKQWWFAVNGLDRDMPARSETGASANGEPFMVKPFHCYVEFNGWPAGEITPYGGIIAAGEAANEDTFIAALKAEIAA